MATSASSSLTRTEFLWRISGLLTAAGLAVASSPDEDDSEECVVVGLASPHRRPHISRDALCVLAADAASAHLYCYPRAKKNADPHWLADIAAALLSGSAIPGPCHPDTTDPAARRLIGLKGVVGMDLRHRGFSVTLHTYPDDYYYGVSADISATGPGDNSGGTVWIDDDGTLYWQHGYRHRPPGPADADTAAESIARAVTAAIRVAWPEPAVA